MNPTCSLDAQLLLFASPLTSATQYLPCCPSLAQTCWLTPNTSYVACLQAVSDFAKSKTLQEQRRFLPVYDCRDELLQVIRENQVVVVVGETGSGKTTQASICTANLLKGFCDI